MVDVAPTEAPVDGVAVTIDGRDVVARKGELLIDVAERNGVYIPRFCYHARMRPVGMCRMCIVEVDTGRGPALQPSCMIECTPGMAVDTESEVVKKVQDGVLEFLLINHPLDCPVCDKGGECPLQDQTLAYGPGESRYLEEKRHLEKPIPISDLVLLDRERCILCDRCTRFASEVAGDPLIHFINRGNQTEVNTFPDEPFASYFSGNTVQICPVGALTATSYRFKARPWDLEQVESTCQTCSVGCRISIDSSRNEVLRFNGVDVDPVNWGWLCDKGRFAFEAVGPDDRLREPLQRGTDGLLGSVRWTDAIVAAATAMRDAGPDGLGVLGGARLTNEGAYAWARLVKGVLGSDNADAQLGDGLPGEVVAGLPRATIDEVCRPGGTVVLLGPDVKEELPVLFLRLRHAAVQDGVTVIEVSPRSTGFTPYAAASLQYRPGEVAEAVRGLLGTPTEGKDAGGVDADRLAAARHLLAAADGPVTVVLGRASVAESADFVVDAAGAILTARPDTTFLPALRRGNVHGAIDMGLTPGLLPGRVALADGAEWFTEQWGGAPQTRGLDAHGMLTAAAEGRLRTLVLLGADPLGDFPDRDLVERALAAVPMLIAVDTNLTASSARAHLVLAAAGFAEVDGTTTNLEGRVSTVQQKVTPPGTARPDWMIAAELASALQADLGLGSTAEVLAEIERVATSHAGLDVTAIGIDGAVVPLPVLSAPADDPTDDVDTAEPPTADAAADADAGTPEAAEAPEGSPEAAEPAPQGLTRPAMVTFVPPAPVELVALDAYALRIVATRKLYDLGVAVQRSSHLAGLAPGTELHLHPYDFARLGVLEGTAVSVTSPRSSERVPVVVDAGVPRGAAAFVVNQPGLDVYRFLDASMPVVSVRVDSGAPT